MTIIDSYYEITGLYLEYVVTWIKRIGLFLLVNFLVILTISVILSLFNVRPYLDAHGIHYRSLLIFCLVWGMGGALISLALSKVMAKWLMGVKIIHPHDGNSAHQTLLKLVTKLSKEAGLRAIPEVGIFHSKSPNAFATGPTHNQSLVAVSSGLLEKMNMDEIEGVLAHEISHIANGDMITMTLLQGIVNAFVMFLARVLALVFSGAGRSQQSRGGSYAGYYMLTFIFQTVFMLLGFLVIAGFSRYREYRADFGGARLAGRGKMIAALQRLKAQPIPHSMPAHQSIQALMISNPLRMGWAKLFSTHPPLEERIARLRHTTAH